jgi:hypothetical protein
MEQFKDFKTLTNHNKETEWSENLDGFSSLNYNEKIHLNDPISICWEIIDFICN